jgi:hypothetical protein
LIYTKYLGTYLPTAVHMNLVDGLEGQRSEWHWQLSASTGDQRRRYALVSSRPGTVATWPAHFNFMEEAVHAMPLQSAYPYAVFLFGLWPPILFPESQNRNQVS